jgi:hypothetical protein
MHIPEKLNGYAMTEASWIAWLAFGYSGGGVPLFLQRALYLVGRDPRVRGLGRRIASMVPSGPRCCAARRSHAAVSRPPEPPGLALLPLQLPAPDSTAVPPSPAR